MAKKSVNFIYIYIERESWVQVILSVTLNDITTLNNLLLDANFEKSPIGLHYIHILTMLAKFYGDQRSIVMSSINFLNSSFCSLKYYIKNEFMDHMVNNIQLA